MKIYKKLGLGITFVLVCLTFFGVVTSNKASAAIEQFTANPFAGATYTLNNGKITTLIARGTTQQRTLTFTNTTAKPLVYTSDAQIFCTGTSTGPGIAATITLARAPSGATFGGNLVAVYFNSAGGSCNTGANGNKTINNQDQTTGGTPGLPATLLYNGVTYDLIDSSLPLYGLNQTKGSDCYGGSVILTNAAGTSGTAFVGLEGNGGTTPLQPSLVSAGAKAATVNLITGCGFQDSTAKTDGYSGTITNGKLNADAPPGADSDASKPDPCLDNSGGWALTWAVCPVLDAASVLSQKLIDIFEDQLSFSVSQLGQGQDQVHKSWALIRDLATALIVVVTLVMIISQALSFGPFDAYTIRKMLPRIVAAVILIQISWIGVSWVIDVVNATARGIADILYYPFGGTANMDLYSLLGHANIHGVTVGALNWAALGVGLALGIAFGFTMLGVALVAIIGLFAAVLTLIFRKVLIIILLVFAPLALLAWILPGTERYWKMWRDNLIKVLFMFPIAVAIIAAGRVFAYVVGTQPGNGGEFIALLFVLVGFFGPLFILPKTFKWGGQAMSLAGGAIQNAGTKAGVKPKAFLGKRQEGYSALRRSQSQQRFANKQGFSWKKPKSYVQRPLDLVKSGKWDPTLYDPFTKGERSKHAQDSYVHAGEETEKKDIEAARSRLVRQGQAIRAKGGNHDLFYQKAGEGEKEYWDPSYVNEDGSKGKMIEVGKLSHTERTAARTQTAILGSATNWRYLEELHQKMEAKNANGTFVMPEAQRVETRKFFDDNVDKIMPKMPHFYQGYGATAETSGPALAGLHAVEAESVLSHFSKQVEKYHAMSIDPSLSPTQQAEAASKRAGAQNSLLTFAQNIREAAKNPNINLDLGMLKAAKGFLDPVNGVGFTTSINDDPNGSVDNHPDGVVRPSPNARHTRNLPELKAYTAVTGLDAGAQATIKDIAAELAPRIDKVTGAIDRKIGDSSPAPKVVVAPGPGELRIAHQESASINLPTGVELSNPAQLQTYKARLQTDATAIQTLAHGLAYGVLDDKTAHLRVLDDLKTEIEALPATTDGEKAAKSARVGQYNGMLDQIRQAYTQRITQTAQAAADRGHDRTAALTAAQNRLAPEITADIESRRIV